MHGALPQDTPAWCPDCLRHCFPAALCTHCQLHFRKVTSSIGFTRAPVPQRQAAMQMPSHSLLPPPSAGHLCLLFTTSQHPHPSSPGGGWEGLRGGARLGPGGQDAGGLSTCLCSANFSYIFRGLAKWASSSRGDSVVSGTLPRWVSGKVGRRKGGGLRAGPRAGKETCWKRGRGGCVSVWTCPEHLGVCPASFLPTSGAWGGCP